jgi:hypothetical protein
MRRIFFCHFAPSLFLGAFVFLGFYAFLTDTPCAAADKGPWRSLFDGESFEGWEGNLEVFRIEDGALVGGSLDKAVARNEFLCTTEQFDNFEMRLKVKVLGPGANAGVQFRTQRIPDHHEVSGYQADVGEGWWGKLYDESRRNRVLAGPSPEVDIPAIVRSDQWNEYRIRCRGPHIELFLNGQKTVDYTEPDQTVARTGVVAIQIHGGPPSEAWYKDIEIRKLESSADAQ